MKIRLTSIMVEDQERALQFYTQVLGFEKQQDFPAGEYRWITVAAPGRDDLLLSLEPNVNPAGKTFQQALFAQQIPATAFESDDLTAECARLKEQGVTFTTEPRQMGPVRIAVFSDTCGNLIQLYQPS
jgi:predicted enzyme related to lactoylglutathione lyase